MDIKEIIRESCGFKNIGSIKRTRSFKGNGSKIVIYSIRFTNLQEKKVFVKTVSDPQKIQELKQDFNFYTSNFKKLNKNPYVNFPKIYYCKDNILVEEHICGDNLEELFFRGKIKNSKDILFRIGKGLRATEKLFSLNSKDRSFFRKQNNLRYYLNVFPRDIKNKINNYLNTLDELDFLDKNIMNFGDVQLKNIILDKSNNLYFVDLNVFFGSRFMDPAQLIYNMKRHLIRPYFHFQKKRFNQSIHSFLEGFLEKEQEEYKIIRFNLLYLLIQNYVALNKSDRNIFFKKYLAFNFLKQINSLLDKGVDGFIYS